MTLKRYDAVVNGVETILLLNAEDASQLGDAVTLHEKAAAKPANKAAPKPRNKAAAKPANKAAPKPRNKAAAKPANKESAPAAPAADTGTGEPPAE